MRKSVPVLTPLFKKRNEIISSPEVQGDFWIRVFSTAPSEIDEYILPTDAAVLGAALKNLTVERFEVDANGNGEPRSLRFTFDFNTGEDNPFFDNSQIVKEFFWRKDVTKTASGKRRVWEGLVSEPVRINWKKDMDVTKGVLDAACDLFEAEKKGGDRKKLPQWEALVKKLAEAEAEADAEEEQENDDDENVNPVSPAGVSFFGFFGYRGRDVSAEKSKQSVKEEDERWAKISKGEKVEDDEEEDDDDDDELEDDFEEAEVFPDGEFLAIAIAEDLWTDAMKYYGMWFCRTRVVKEFQLTPQPSAIVRTWR